MTDEESKSRRVEESKRPERCGHGEEFDTDHRGGEEREERAGTVSGGEARGEGHLHRDREARDAEMEARIANHRRARPSHWRTIERPTGAAAAMREANGKLFRD